MSFGTAFSAFVTVTVQTSPLSILQDILAYSVLGGGKMLGPSPAVWAVQQESLMISQQLRRFAAKLSRRSFEGCAGERRPCAL
jgi:hypothetical protein